MAPLAIGEGRTPHRRQARRGEKLYAAEVIYTIKVDGRQTAGTYTLTELALNSGGVIPALRHPRFEEGLYVLDGEVTAAVAGREFIATPGDFVIIPWGLTHEIKNAAGKPARLLST